MKKLRPSTISEYIDQASASARPHLESIYALLSAAAPNAQETIKWGTPCFVEPRFVFAFAAHKHHISFEPTSAGLAAFRDELEEYTTTDNHVHFPYDEPLPKALIRKIAKQRVKDVSSSKSNSFW